MVRAFVGPWPAVWIVVATGASGLAGCVDVVVDDPPPAASASPTLARRESVSPRAASLSFASLNGAPQGVSDAFRTQFVAQAGLQEIDLADAKKAPHGADRRGVKAIAGTAPRHQTAVAGTVASPIVGAVAPGLGIAALQ